MNVNLHPKLVQFLVELFHSKESNTKNAQLIFTTHETSILTQDVFRRDQIWFCERSKEQSSVLYPLSDFSPKKGKENLELGYLSGRYGALPLLAHFLEYNKWEVMIYIKKKKSSNTKTKTEKNRNKKGL